MKINTVPVIYVKAMLHSAINKGCEPSKLLKGAGIAPELLDSDRSRVAVTNYSKLSRLIIDELEDEAHGFLLTPLKPGTFAMMCFACIHCKTLGEFLERGVHFFSMTGDSLTPHLKTHKDNIEFSLALKHATADPNNVAIVSMLSIFQRLSSWLIGQNITLNTVSFTHSRPKNASEYNLLFKAPIEFEASKDSLIFSPHYLDMPNIQNIQTLESFLSVTSLNLMSIPDYENSLAESVRQILSEVEVTSMPDLDWTANKVGLTSATLRRRLKNEGTSYKTIKDDIRRDTAIYYLSKGAMSIEETAEKVGFTETASFYRAFKRWTGVTPRDYIDKP